MRNGTEPAGLPLLGHLVRFKRDPLGLLNAARANGDLTRLRFGPRTAFVVNHPDLIEEVLVIQHRVFAKSCGRKFSRLSRFLAGGEQVDRVTHFPADNDFWMRQRPTIQPAFFHPQVSAYGDVMTRVIEGVIADWRVGEVRDVYVDMVRLAFRIVATTLFGEEDESEQRTLADAFETIMFEIAQRLANPLHVPPIVPTRRNRRLVRAVADVERIVDRLVERHRSGRGGGGALLEIMLKDNRTQDPEWRYNVVGLFVAGYETTAVALTWTWHLLATHPDEEAKLRAELAGVLGDRAPSPGNVQELTYTEAILKESLRLYPPLWAFAREAVEDFTLGAQKMPAGTIVIISPWVTHRDGRYFDDPNAFRPSRWLGSAASQPPKYAYMPFSAGPRSCIGQRFALLEMLLAIATVAQRFRLADAAGSLAVPKPWIGLRPRYGMPMVVTAARS
ncbi:MAG: cytochrome P450 [Vicinamibacterales bacterium]